MAVEGSNYSFKREVRTPRIQHIEENYAKGMQHSSGPLTSGFLKTSVNYDIKNEGETLEPRPGLRTSKLYTATGEDASTYFGVEQIFEAKEQTIGDNRYAQFLLSQTQTGTDRLRKGNLLMLTGTGVAGADFTTGVVTETYRTEEYPNANYMVSEGAGIHGLNLPDTNQILRQVGTYAWNQNYYFFDPVLNKVVYTKWDAATAKFIFETSSPKEVTSKESVMWGYNMLKENPYTFANTNSAAGGIIELTGMLPYDVNGVLSLSPVVNQSLSFAVFYSVPADAKYHMVWEWRSANGDTWTTIKEYDVQFTTLLDQKLAFSPPTESIVIRVQAFGYNAEDVRNPNADAVLAVGFNFNKADYGSTANVEPVTYALKNATGMVYWKKRLVVWGVPEDPTVLFASEVNDPTYFPYPNNCDTFDEPIKYAVVFQDYLLVFTSTQLHMLMLSADGLSWSRTCIQNNLAISDWDVHLIQVVKNMLFFRSGNYYYMIVPKATSATGELAIAPVSKPLYNLFDTFKNSIAGIISETYNYSGSLELLHYYNFLDFEDVHNNYVFSTDTDELLNVCLLYNTVTRSWRMYTYGSQQVYLPYKADATQRGTLCCFATVDNGDNTETIAPQLLQFYTNLNADHYIPRNVTTVNCESTFEAAHWAFNWQFLDTGYRELNSNFKKRYREVQFIINNVSNKALKFYTDFFIDGMKRVGKYQHLVTQELDPESPNYGVLTVEKVLADPLTAPSTTMLGAAEDDTEAWMLDVSMFPDVAFWKARLPVSGKGYIPRLMLTCHNEDPYELQNISWVYRDMYSR